MFFRFNLIGIKFDSQTNVWTQMKVAKELAWNP